MHVTKKQNTKTVGVQSEEHMVCFCKVRFSKNLKVSLLFRKIS